MSLSQIRTFFRARAATALAGYKEWKDAFDFENIDNANIHKLFHVEQVSYQSGPKQDQIIIDEADINIRIHKKANKNNTEELDSLLDAAHNFRLECINGAYHGTNIKNVICNSITPEPVGDNSSVIRITINFTVFLYFNGDA